MAKQQNDEQLTPEKYRQKADEHISDLKQEWRVFAKTGLIVLVALLAIIVIGIAWFASNRTVTGSGMMIRSAGNEFELAAEGITGSNKGAFDNKLDSTTVKEGEQQNINGKSLLATDGSHTSISWAITDESSIGNQENSGTGINPGSKGKLTFYIIAKKSGKLEVNLNLTLAGVGDNGSVEVDEAARLLMEGHILLFAGYDSTTNSYSGWISADASPWRMTLQTEASPTLSRNEDGSLVWSADNVEEGTAYPVTLCWIWPEVLGEYLFKDQTHLGSRPVLFPSDSDGDPDILPSGLFAEMVSTAGSYTYSNRYFRWTLEDVESNVNNTLKTEFKSLATVTALQDLRNDNYNTVTYGNLCSYYNMADQYLGEKIRYVYIKLDAQ